MRFVVACILLFASIVAACSEFSSQEGASFLPTDGGPNGLAPVTGTPSGVLAMTLPEGTTMLTHGNTERIRVSISRSGGFIGPVRFTLRGAPEGISANFLELEPGVTEGNLEVVIDPSFPQGPLPGISVEASNTTVGLTVASVFSVFVRGTSGEIDTTYADGGAQQAGPVDFVARAKPSTGEAIFANTPFLPATPSEGRDANGGLVGNFRTDLVLPSSNALAQRGDFFYVCSANGAEGSSSFTVNVSRFNFSNGSQDGTFSRVTAVAPASALKAAPSVSACFVFDDQTIALNLFYEDQTSRNSAIGWFDPMGSYRSTSFGPGILAQLQDGLVALVNGTTSSSIQKFSKDSYARDTSFGTAGSVTSGGFYDKLIGDDAGRVIVASTGSILRLTAKGSLDGTFVGATTAIVGASIGQLAVQTDGKIV